MFGEVMGDKSDIGCLSVGTGNGVGNWVIFFCVEESTIGFSSGEGIRGSVAETVGGENWLGIRDWYLIKRRTHFQFWYWFRLLIAVLSRRFIG